MCECVQVCIFLYFLQSLSGYKTTTGIMVFQGSLPEILSIYTQGFQQRLRTYALDCTGLSISPCLAYDVTVSNDTSMVFIQIDTTLIDLSLVMSGFQNDSTVSTLCISIHSNMYICIIIYLHHCIYKSTHLLSVYLSMLLHIYLFMYLRIYLSMYLFIYVSIYICFYLCMYVCMYVCIYLSIYVSMYVSIYLHIKLSIYSCINSLLILYSIKHFEILEVTIRGIVVSEYYLPGLHSVKAEGEDGILLSSESGFGSLVLLSDQNEFPGFSSRGYVNLAYGSEDVRNNRFICVDEMMV